MRLLIERRLDSQRDRLPEGCPACRAWPHVWLMTDRGPEPPECCDQCGRQFSGLTRVYLPGIDIADI